MRLLQLLFVYGMIVMNILIGCHEKKDTPKVIKREISALSLIRKDDCLTCHSIEDKSAAPAYVRISQRYGADEITVNKLADKIISGGGGLWGGVMSEHPFLKKTDAVKIVHWILSLDDSISNPDPMVNTSGITLEKSFKEPTDGKSGQMGLFLKAFSLQSFGDYGSGFPDIREGMNPLYSGIVSKIHMPGQESFQPLSKGFVLEATGFIHIKTKGKYFFKQVKTGGGRFFLNGEKKINESDWDSETVVDLSPGIYPVKIDYQSSDGNDTLSLQWITPEQEYYQVIPEEAFTYR